MNGWILGVLIGFTVVVVVVVLLLLMILGIIRIAEKAEGILAALYDAREGTAALWQVAGTVSAAERIVAAATKARVSLDPGGRT